MKTTASLQPQHWDEEIIKILKYLGSLEAEYPPDLLAARRAAFIHQVQQQAQVRAEDKLTSRGLFLQRLEGLKSVRAEYPPELLSARRAEFVDLLRQYSQTESVEELTADDQELLRLLKNIRSVEAGYPSHLLAARRAALQHQLRLGDRVSILDALRTSIRNLFLHTGKTFTLPPINKLRLSLVAMVLVLAMFASSLLRSPVQPSYSSSGEEVPQPGPLSVITSTVETAKVICKPGYLPPLCLAKEFDKSRDLTFPGNGLARPAVAKDTLPGFSGVHSPAYVNDGLYGPGASWISNSPYSWVKIDLGKATTINTVAFGRDRLGNFNDRDPGQFVIAVALNDNVYADGNSSNDYIEYTEIYHSDQAGFDGVVSGPETVQAQFGPVMARFVKIIFANPGTAVDEIEVFMVQRSAPDTNPTRKPKDDLLWTSTSVPTSTATPIPTSTPLPTNTATPIPTNTPLPTDTATPVPTDTPRPTNTPIPEPTDTPIPPPTETSVPATEFAVPWSAPTESPAPEEIP